MVFLEKWLRNHPKFLLHFIYTFMSLCYVESLSRFRAQIFKLLSFLKNVPISENFPVVFSKKWLLNKSPKIFITF